MATEQPIFFAETGDPAMNQAFQRAQDTFGYFWRELSWEYRRIVPGLEIACVKVAFSQQVKKEPIVEHMWINEVSFDGETIKGVLLNDPNRLTNVSRGQGVEIPLAQVSDWLFARGGKTFGGFTIQAMRSRMDAAGLESHDKAWGFDFGDHRGILLAAGQLENPENLEEHPMSRNMGPKLAEFLTQYPSQLHSADEAGNTMLHKEAIAGNRTSVEVLKQFGADLHAKNKLGKTPLDYAVQMKWDHLVPLLS